MVNLDLDLNLYKTFYVVAKKNSFTKASKILFISQPAVTQAIKKLEEQLDIELFKRTSKGIKLTKDGEKVYYYAEKLCQIANASCNLIDELKNNFIECINIGVPTHIGSFYLIDYLKKFYQLYPNVRVNIINKKSDEMLAMLIKREIDVLINTDMQNVDNQIIKKYKILDLDSCFVGNEKFKMISELEFIKAEDLVKYPLVLPSKTTFNRKLIDLYFQKKNILLSPLIEVSSSSISKEIIYNGLGIGWMIKDFVKNDIEQGILYEIKVDIEKILTPVYIAYHDKYVKDIVKEFIKLFKNKI